MNWILLFSIATFSTSAAQAMCMPGEEIDLRKVRNDIFSEIKIRDQQDYGICYAHAAATLIDFHRKLKKSDGYQSRSTDPIGAAAFSTVATDDSSVEGGHICEVIQAQVQAGVGCGYSGVSFRNIRGLGDSTQVLAVKPFLPYITRKKTYQAIDPEFFPKMNRKLHQKAITSDQMAVLIGFDEYIKAFEAEIAIRSLPRSLFPSGEKLFQFVQSLHLENRWSAYQGEVEYMAMKGACEKNSYKMPVLRCAEYSNSQADLIEIVNDDLRRGYPTGASICSSVLANRRYVGLRTNGTHFNDCGEHAVVVIGKRYSSGQCQYLIRNSWGMNARYDWSTSGGDVWVDESALQKNMFEAQIVR